MTDQSPENSQFFLTAAMPCPYLEGREERKLFTHLSGRRASMLHHVLNEHGFRRSQNLIYRPACDGCSACRSVRIPAHDFTAGGRHRRILRRNQDIIGTQLSPRVSAEQYDLFKLYLETRHEGGGMTQMSYMDYEYMVEDTPVNSVLIEYRLAQSDGTTGPLVAVALSDLMDEGLSMVYSFFDPSHAARGLGNFMILDHIRRVIDSGLKYVYLGYWVPNSPKMAYKASFQPLEVQSGTAGWQRLDIVQAD
ncbi:arginyltransferase [Mariluticola halotolerans]|uniref:arginyltransferase n=1 Tax=Mariluticola halotolerans TaxID=2909283 RepID=UPI0026E3237D|nr:arginyltransferase [Mariluticola halotolerans]UJQ95660.1 arginyltransferase [Mariluticola halotolerans]